ncbi:MAG: hypothetical protein H7A34_05360 [bacterium]|nr:hypothetical protein [bacterium]
MHKQIKIILGFVVVLLWNSSVQCQPMQGIYDEAMEFGQPETAQADRLVIDDFEEPSKLNLLHGMTNVYLMAPSRVMMSTAVDERDSTKTVVLKLKFQRFGEGGPYGKGGWCGYYSAVKEMLKTGTKYFDATNYTYLTLWVRGEIGGENFILGMSDKHWDKAGDTVKSNQIIAYLPEKKITTKWQQARVPLSDFMLDLSKLASIAISFERECFPDGIGDGVVYIDDIAFE